MLSVKIIDRQIARSPTQLGPCAQALEQESFELLGFQETKEGDWSGVMVEAGAETAASRSQEGC